MIFTLAARELKTLFLSPLAWSILAVAQVILGLLFLGRVEAVQTYQPQLLTMENAPGVTELVVPELFGNAAIILLLIVPLLTMRLLAEERRNRTLTLLFSAPISMSEIVLGKYLGVLGFLLLLVALIALMPLSLLLGAGLDMGMLLSAVVGLALLAAGFAAVGVFMSALTQHPALAAIGTFGVLLVFWILDLSGQGNTDANLLAYLSLFNHYQPFLKGVLKTTDVAYHLMLSATFLVLSVRRLDADRLGA